MDHYKLLVDTAPPREETVETSHSRAHGASDAVQAGQDSKAVVPHEATVRQKPLDLDMFVRFRRRDRLRDVDWRRKMAVEWLGSQARWLPKTPKDRTVRALCRYLKRKEEDLPPLKWDLDLEQAEALWLGSESRQRALLQAWLLSGTDHSVIAKKVELPQKVVDLFASGFFDVGKRVQAPSFVVHKILRLHSLDIETFAEGEYVTWQLDAAFYGPDHLEELIAISNWMRDPTVALTGISLEASEALFLYHRHVLNTAVPVTSSLSPKHVLQAHIRSLREELKRRRQKRKQWQYSSSS